MVVWLLLGCGRLTGVGIDIAPGIDSGFTIGTTDGEPCDAGVVRVEARRDGALAGFVGMGDGRALPVRWADDARTVELRLVWQSPADFARVEVALDDAAGEVAADEVAEAGTPWPGHACWRVFDDVTLDIPEDVAFDGEPLLLSYALASDVAIAEGELELVGRDPRERD